MAELLWDASALVKRYVQETGSDTVQALFARQPAHLFATTVWGYAEAFSILLRRHNGAVISRAAFHKATSALRNEVLIRRDVTFVSVPDATVIGSIGLMQRHSVNATDGAILRAFLNYARLHPPGAPSYILISADKRLIRAARAEGLDALDPEVVHPGDLTAELK